MQDFNITAKFADTEATIAGATEAGKAEFFKRFGGGCVSVNVRKSALPEFVSGLQRAGFTVAGF